MKKYIHAFRFNLNCGKCGSSDIAVSGKVFECLDCGNTELATEHEKVPK